MSASLFAPPKKTMKLFKNAQNTLHRDFCKNAVTGANYPYLGSTNEAYDNLFVYRNVTGVLDLANPFNLYYDSPEQCENHLGIKINDHIKNSWKENMEIIIKQNIENETQETTERQSITVK